MDRIFTKLHLEKIAKHSLPLMFAAAAAFNCNAAIVDHWGMNFETNTTRKTATFTGLVNRTRPQWAEAVNIPATFTDNGVTYTVTAIGQTALARLETKSVTIPSTVTEIGTSAFYLCTIKEITLPEGLKRIQKQAFMESNIESISIPSSVIYIGDMAFANKTLTSVTFAPCESSLSLGESVFESCHRLQEAILPEGLTKIGKKCFKDCGIRKLSIPSTLTSIPTDAFILCSQLTEVQFTPGALGLIGNSAFSNTAIENIELPEGLYSIGFRAFDCAYALETVKLPASVNTISERSFERCDNIREITILNPETPTVNENSFTEATFNNATLFVPDAAVETYRNADVWKLFKTIRPLSSSGIHDIISDRPAEDTLPNSSSAANALPEEIYTLSGMRVNHTATLPAGVYIVRRGTTATKTVIR